MLSPIALRALRRGPLIQLRLSSASPRQGCVTFPREGEGEGLWGGSELCSALVAEERAVTAFDRLLGGFLGLRLGRGQRLQGRRLAGGLAGLEDRGVEVGLGAEAKQHRVAR